MKCLNNYVVFRIDKTCRDVEREMMTSRAILSVRDVITYDVVTSDVTCGHVTVKTLICEYT